MVLHVQPFVYGTRVPWTPGTENPGAPVVIVDSKLGERLTIDVLHTVAALAVTAGRIRKSRVADNFDEFVWPRTKTVRGWQTAINAGVVEWIC